MNDTPKNTFVRINAVTLPKAKQALKKDRYVFIGNFPELQKVLTQRKYVPTLPKSAALLYFDKYIILIDCPDNKVRIDMYLKKQEDIIYQIIWEPITDEHRFYCTLENGLSEQKGLPLNYSPSFPENYIQSVDLIIQKNQRATADLARKIVEEVRLFFYMLEHQSNYIRKTNKNEICLHELSKNYEVVRGHSKNIGTTQVAPYLRRRPHRPQ